MAQTYAIEPTEFKQLVYVWAEKLEVEPKEIHLRDMRNKWASMSSTGRLTFSTDLLKRQRKFSDYVIVHELLHSESPKPRQAFQKPDALLPARVGKDGRRDR